MPTKKRTGQFEAYDAAIAAQIVATARAADAASAMPGLLVTDRAAAGGPIIRLKISNAPTTGTVIAVARARISRNAVSIRRPPAPLAAATSGSTDDSSSGR